MPKMIACDQVEKLLLRDKKTKPHIFLWLCNVTIKLKNGQTKSDSTMAKERILCRPQQGRACQRRRRQPKQVGKLDFQELEQLEYWLLGSALLRTSGEEQCRVHQPTLAELILRWQGRLDGQKVRVYCPHLWSNGVMVRELQILGAQ
jgi:hypothetical protein